MSIASSLRKAGYLSLGAEGLGKFLKKMRENQQEEEIAKVSTDTYNKLKELYAPEPKFEEPKETSITALSKEGIKQEIPFEEPSIQIMPDYISPEDRITKSRNVLADYFDKISRIKNIDPERVKKEFSFMQQRSELLEPYSKEYKVEQLDPYKATVKIDKYGNVIPLYQAKENKKTGATKIGEYVGADGFKRFVFMYEDGTIKEVSAQNRTRYEGDTRTKEPKETGFWDIGNILNMINYTTDEKGKAIPRPEEEKEQYRKIGLNMAKGLLRKEAFNWHNTEILGKWGREDLAYEDYNYEIKQALERGEISVEAAQDLITFNSYRASILNIYDKKPFYEDQILGKNSKGKKSEGKK